MSLNPVMRQCQRTAAGFWPIKFCLWIFLLGICFVMPNVAMSGYGQFARVLAGIWLLFQIVILLDFIYDANEWLLKKVSQSTGLMQYVITVSNVQV